MPQKTIISFGEVLWDMLPDGPVLGGAPCNFAFRMQSFGHRSIMISRLGKDSNGTKARDILTKLGLTLEGIQTDSVFPTGTVNVTLDEDHHPDYYIVPDAAYDHIELTPKLEILAKSADAICFGTLAQRSPKTQESLHRLLGQLPSNTLKVYDVNLRKNCYDKETIENSLSKTDILKLSDEESEVIATYFGLNHTNLIEMGGQLLDRWNLKCCLITLGAKGALAIDNSEGTVYQPGFKVKMKEPVGAGDACTAGFIHRFIEGGSLRECCQTGCGIGALVATHSGATEIISKKVLENFISSNKSFHIAPRYEHLI